MTHALNSCQCSVLTVFYIIAFLACEFTWNISALDSLICNLPALVYCLFSVLVLILLLFCRNVYTLLYLDLYLSHYIHYICILEILSFTLRLLFLLKVLHNKRILLQWTWNLLISSFQLVYYLLFKNRTNFPARPNIMETFFFPLSRNCVVIQVNCSFCLQFILCYLWQGLGWQNSCSLGHLDHWFSTTCCKGCCCCCCFFLRHANKFNIK